MRNQDLCITTLSILLSSIGAFFGTISTIPQIFRIIKLKEAHAISYYCFGCKTLGVIFLAIAIMFTGNYLVAVPNLLIIVGNVWVMYLKFYYARTLLNNRNC